MVYIITYVLFMTENLVSSIIYEYNCKPAFLLRDQLNSAAKPPAGSSSLGCRDVPQDHRSEQGAAAVLWGSICDPLGLGE